MPTQAAQDQWGLIRIPLQPPTAAQADGEGQGDPCLWIYLQFLKAFLQTDAQATALWTAAGMAPDGVVVNAIRAHGPGDDDGEPFGLGLSTKDLPCLYMWRHGGSDSSSVEQIAEDWRVETSNVRLLWVFPDAVVGTQRSRQTFVNALAKCIDDAIERGRTPSFIVAGDPDPLAPSEGSFVHTFTEVYSINATHWGPAKVRISVVGDKDAGAASSFQKPALEMRFELKENLIKNPNLWSFAQRGLQQTITSGAPSASPWGPTTLYGAGAVIAVLPLGSLTYYLFQASGAGSSGFATPAWPTTQGATVADASITWTCLGAAPATYSDLWSPLATYAAQTSILVFVAGVPLVFSTTDGGTTAGYAPTWPSTKGQSVTDGSAVWTCRGPSPYAVTGYGPATWAAATLFASNVQISVPVGIVPVNYLFTESAGGTSGTSMPEWPTATGATVADGGLTWTCQGPAPLLS